MGIVIIMTLSHSVNHTESKNMCITWHHSFLQEFWGCVCCQNYVPIQKKHNFSVQLFEKSVQLMCLDGLLPVH